MQHMKKKIKVMNPLGLHARPASIFVRIASKYESKIQVMKDKEKVNGKSMMGILTLAAEQGSDIELDIQGPDAENALSELEHFLSNTTEPGESEGLV